MKKKKKEKGKKTKNTPTKKKQKTQWHISQDYIPEGKWKGVKLVLEGMEGGRIGGMIKK